MASLSIAACGDGPPSGSSTSSSDLVRVERAWPLMGTFLRVSARGPDSAAARRSVEAAHRAVRRIDSLMSTYRDDSEISLINRRAGSGRWTEVSPETLEVVQTSLRWARASDGAFDPTVGPLMAAWGFRGGTEPSPPEPAVVDSLVELVDHGAVEVDGEAGRVRLTLEGAALDFGAVAKGYALDRALGALRAEGARAGMVDLGGNVAVFGPSPRGGAWRLGIRHPRRTGALLGTLETDSGSVSTSGDYEQSFRVDGVRYSHIMDPRTGRPARGVVAVTVAAGEGATADVLSTLLFVLGPEEGRRFLERHGPPGGVDVVWVRADPSDSVHRGLVEIHRGRSGGDVEVELPPSPDGDGSAAGR